MSRQGVFRAGQWLLGMATRCTRQEQLWVRVSYSTIEASYRKAIAASSRGVALYISRVRMPGTCRHRCNRGDPTAV